MGRGYRRDSHSYQTPDHTREIVLLRCEVSFYVKKDQVYATYVRVTVSQVRPENRLLHNLAHTDSKLI